MKGLFTALLVLFSVSVSVGQNYKLTTTDPTAFIADVHVLMAGTRAPESVETGKAFEIAFQQLPEAQKTKVMAIAQLMLKAKLKSRPHFEDYFTLVSAAVAKAGLQGPALDNLLQVTEKVMQKTDSKQAQLFLSTSGQFLQNKVLYAGKTNDLRTFSDNFSFEFAEEKTAAWEEEKKHAATPANPPKTAVAAKTPEPKKEPEKKKDEWAADGWGDDWGSDWDKPAKETKATETAAADDWGTTEELAPIDEPIAAEKIPFYPTPMPIVKGAVLKLTNADLAIVTEFDSAIIEKTTGSILLTEGVFVGKGGSFRWATAGHPDKDISVALNDFTFDIKKPEFVAEMVTITYPQALKEPVQGNLNFKSARRRANHAPDFPRFISLTNDARLNNIGDNIQYKGGFSLSGQRMLSNCIDESPSTIVVTLNGVPKFRAVSRSYALSDTLIASQRTAISIYQGQDSITHPGIRLKYQKNKQLLTLIRETGGFKHAHFFDSYHKMEIKAEVAKWDMNTSKVDFSILNARAEVPVVLESDNFFTPKRYFRTQGVMRFHPLQAAVGYAESKKTSKFYTADFAEYLKLPIKEVTDAMAALARDGYIDYTAKGGLVVIKPRAYHYVHSAKGKKDFDNLQIEALNQASKNATVDLETNDLTVRGVERFYLSDSLGVFVEPKDKEITIKKNRDIVFNGTVYSGNFQFQGTDFLFDYRNFEVDMDKIDKISFVIKDDQKKDPKAKAGKNGTNKQSFGSPTQHSQGKLYINKPDNKSNRKQYAKYPYFDAQTGTNMYFNRPEVLGGAYDTSIFFKVPPFTVDSLERKSGNSAIDFAGEFNGGNIFPPFAERLHVMPDKSLGFDHQVPAEGYSTFGKGRFFDKLSLNAGGLRGKGKLTYLSATLLSDDFVFYLDSVTTRPGSDATIKEGPVNGVFIPDVAAKNYWLRWAALNDSMHIGSVTEPLSLYKNNLTLTGNVTLTPTGLFGQGVTENAEAKITAPFYHFKENFFNGRHATFAIKTEGKKSALRAKDALVEFDIKNRTALFSPEVEGVANVTFPALQYKTSLSGGKADFNTKMVTMQMPAGSDIRKSYFYSTHPAQDSLVFQATGAAYDMEKTTLNIYGIPYIAVLDAHVIPDSGRVFIQEGAVMQTLHNAGIVMDTAHKFHTFKRAELDIESSRRMRGTAMYQYTNAGETPFSIPFDEFLVDSAEMTGTRNQFAYFTKAHGYVEEASEFYITPGVLYKGDVTVRSDKRDLSIKGFAKFAFNEDANSDWFAFEQEVNPASVGFSVDKLTASDGSVLHTGLHISGSTNTPYSTFASQKLDAGDLDVLTVKGLFSYDKARKEYVIGDENKVINKGYQGNIMRYNSVTSHINFEGTVNLMPANKNFALQAGGYGIGIPDSNKYQLSLAMGIAPNMHSSITDAMGKALADHPHDVARALTADTMLLYRLAEFVGDKDTKEFKKKISNGYLSWPKLSGKLEQPIMLSQIDMHWSQAHNAWYSKGPIGVSNIGKHDVNAMMTGYLEVRKTPDGDAFGLYLETGAGVWYYFGFAQNALTLASSDASFRTAVEEKASKNAITPKNFGVQLGNTGDKDMFVDYFRLTYLGQQPRAGAGTPPPARVQQQQQESIPEAQAEETTKKKKRKKDREDETTQEQDNGIPVADPTQQPDPQTSTSETVPAEPTRQAAPESTNQQQEIVPVPAEVIPQVQPETTPTEPAAEQGKKKKEKKSKKEKKADESLFPDDEIAPANESGIDQAQPADVPVKQETRQEEIPAQLPVETPVETPANPIEIPAETPPAIPADIPAETPAETPVQTPADTPVTPPAEIPVQTPVESPTETPVETPAETPTQGIPTDGIPSNENP